MAIIFDGVDDKLQKTTGIISSFPVTYFCRFRLPTGSAPYIFSISNTGSTGNYSIFGTESSKYLYQIRQATAPTPNEFGWPRLLAGTPDTSWHNAVIISYSSSSHEIFIDGVSIGTNTVGTAFPNINKVQVGHWVRNGSSGYSNVEVSEWAIWNRALSAEERENLGKSNIIGLSRQFLTDQKLHWILDTVADGQSGNGVIITDFSNNSLDGTLDDGANNTGTDGLADPFASYPYEVINVDGFVLPIIELDENISLTENIITSISLVNSNISENISLTENIITNVSLVKLNISENIDLLEIAHKSISKRLQEFIELTDTSVSKQAISTVISENLQLSESISKSLTKRIIESLDLTETIDPSPSNINKSISENLQLSENITVVVFQEASKGSKIISFNPLMIVTDTDPAKIVKVDITDPENPIHTVTTLIGARSAKDIARNSITGFLYVACADGIVVKIDETDLNNQTIIDLSDTNNLHTIEVLDIFNLTYTSTDNSTGELYMIDERTTVLGDFRLDVLHTQTVFGDLQFDTIEVQSMNSNFNVLETITTGYLNTDFKCLDSVIDPGSPVTPSDQITPIKQTDFVIFVDSVQLEQFDVDLSSINIIHSIDQESTVTFNLTRKHDQMDLDLGGNTRQITNQNAVKITIQGRTEFDGFVANLDCQYNETNELITVTATATEKISSFSNVTLSLPSLNSRLGLYEILIQNPKIYNPVIDPDDTNPARYKGIRVNLGEKRVQSFSRWTIFDSSGSIAKNIQDGIFIPFQNWTYFWSPTVRKFGIIDLGNTSEITFFYIGTSLSPVSEDLWILTNAKYRRQRQYEDIITRVGTTGIITEAEIEILNLGVDASDLFNDLKTASYIDVSGNILTKFTAGIFLAENMQINRSYNIKLGLYNLLDDSIGYYIGSAPFKKVNTRNGIFESKFHWVDESNGLYSIKELSYNFEDFAKETADLEYQLLFNINGEIFPETSCDIQLTIDGYYYYNLTLLNRINVDNTTQTGIYKDSNGFPVSIKGININSGTMKTVLTTDNLKSTQELEEINGLFPNDSDERFHEDTTRILIAGKSDMRTRLSVE